MDNSWLMWGLFVGLLVAEGFAIWWPNRRRLFQIKTWTLAKFFLLLVANFGALLLLANTVGITGNWLGWLNLLLVLAAFGLTISVIGGLFTTWLLRTEISKLEGERYDTIVDDRRLPGDED